MFGPETSGKELNLNLEKMEVMLVGKSDDLEGINSFVLDEVICCFFQSKLSTWGGGGSWTLLCCLKGSFV